MIDPNLAMGAVTLKVSDLEKVSRFYQDVIGLRLLEQTSTAVTLGTAVRPLVQLRHLGDGCFVSHTAGLYHMALRVPTRQALANWLSHYGMLDAPHWQGSADHGVSNALYLSDPEGNGIEVYWDRPRAEWPQSSDGSLTMYTRALDLQTLLREAEQDGWSGVPPETDMGHIHLKTADIPSARQFYVDTLGFESIIELPGSALFIAAGGYHHHIGLNTWHSRQAPPVPDDAHSLAQYEILFASQAALEATVERLKAAYHTIKISDSGLMVRDSTNIAIALRLFQLQSASD